MKTSMAKSNVLKEFEQALLKATPSELEVLLGQLEDKDQIEDAVNRMQSGLKRLLLPKVAEREGTYALAAFASAKNSVAQNARIRLALAIALNPKLGDEIGFTIQTAMELSDTDALSLYESLSVDRRSP